MSFSFVRKGWQVRQTRASAIAVAAVFPFIASGVSCYAATATIDTGNPVAGSNFHTLSAAVAYVQGVDSGPHQIDILSDAITLDSTQILISEPITINGDADGDDISCDILVDVATLRADTHPNVGRAGKAYLEIETAGNVTINDLKLHPNENGGIVESPGTGNHIVNPVSTYKPSSGVGNYTFNNVRISGSVGTAPFAYRNLDTETSMYSSGNKMWYAYQIGATSNANACFFISNAGGAGSYNTTLNDCHAGLARSTAVGISNASGTTTINGGVFGHTGVDVIRVQGGTGVTIQGTESNRVRVLRASQSSGGEGVRLVSGSIAKLSYIDSYQHLNAASAFAFYNGTVTFMEYCRGWGGNTGGSIIYISGATNLTAQNCTFWSNVTGTTKNPFQTASFTGTVNCIDCIFASSALGQINRAGTGTVTFTNCALPTDGYANESLNITTPISGAVVLNGNTVNTSPKFESATFAIANAANFNWRRPTNGAAYTGVATGGANLTGGAGGTAVPVSLSGFTIE